MCVYVCVCVCVCVCVNRVVGVDGGHLEHIIDIRSQSAVGKMNSTLQLLESFN